ncbi:MAG: ATP-binding protein [Comamonadaceae bacterium]|nr:ATP-binding protein [Comamonadaceae bacterium]
MKGVLIETILNGDLPFMYADPDRIRQILFNLLGNAIKYTNQGDRVMVETEAVDNSVLFSVSDHGPGVPEGDIPHLFDIYHRTEEARQSKTKGLGLGLFIVKSLVDLHQGQITVESGAGKRRKVHCRYSLSYSQQWRKRMIEKKFSLSTMMRDVGESTKRSLEASWCGCNGFATNGSEGIRCFFL